MHTFQANSQFFEANSPPFLHIIGQVERFFVNQFNNNLVVVGGVRKLSEFDRSRVVVAVVGAQVLISGDGLKIARFDENEICVAGKISCVETAPREVRRFSGGASQ